ncbi:hypothetical protein P153DRAFT_378806 [Dothidotthia symphoricarpi CBS 119687]|uniref:tRNA-splicing endonuclease subunit Sen2 n=1 Tax=Dothidotthia symphoricarpi CBS 119687 TaxID=1392245 RepID=A0A6A6A2A9_9PLEO|nr:uncharacterized protein P153DRAFT_378806 [Dothidotthia symphoricarpi CBS 119687]KAF2125335.1 hypothetical protein P153DRAFT_378806 [Dothidotthia symphoricarpi CBS 119687]
MCDLRHPVQASRQDIQAKDSAASQNVDNTSKGGPRKPRQMRPNYNEIHAKPLPLDVYPLPTFIPHNPISIVRIAVNLLSHSLWSPNSHKVIHKAYFSPETQSIHITDPQSIRALWEQGFWGKGSLSRSEPQWLIAEKRRRGIEASKTSAEVTLSRREVRNQFKLERARAQREEIEQQLRQEGKLAPDETIGKLVEDGQLSESDEETPSSREAGNIDTTKGDVTVSEVNGTTANETPSQGAKLGLEAEIEDMEHLQLTLEEAFFLTYVLGVLEVVNGTKGSYPLPAWFLVRLYSAHSTFSESPSQLAQQMGLSLHSAHQPQHLLHQLDPAVSYIPSIAPDNDFLLRYVVFHHFRSLGWVVRPGIKFGIDYLIYIRGPAFHHAEFAITIVPSYSHPYWSETPERLAEKKKNDWWWFHRVHRVQTQALKTLVLVYVEVPPPWDKESMGGGFKVDIGTVLKRYTLREFVFKRWSPSRNRD